MKCTDCNRALAVYGTRCGACRDKTLHRLDTDRRETQDQREARQRRDRKLARMKERMYP